MALSNPHVSWTSLGAAVLWMLAVALVAMDVFTEVNSGDVGIVSAAAGATLTVRGYILKLSAEIQVRERNAFEIGRDVRRIREG